MDNLKAFEIMVNTIKEFGECTITCSNGDEYNICPATQYVGGEEGYYMCDRLGNVQYDNIEEICNDLLDNIEGEIEEVNVD